MDRQTDRKTTQLLSLVIKTRVVQNVYRMSKSFNMTSYLATLDVIELVLSDLSIFIPTWNILYSDCGVFQSDVANSISA